MTILVDTQHRPGHSGDVAALLRKHITPKSLVQEVYLPYGDVVYTGNGPRGTAIRIGVEIKKTGDVLACLQSGRFSGLGGQLEGMHRDYDICWLVIEDDLRPDPSTGVLLRWLETLARGARGIDSDRGAKRGLSLHSARRREAGAGSWVPALFGAKRTLRYTDLTNWLTSVQIQSIEDHNKPLFVWRCSSRDELAQWLSGQYRWWNEKPFEQHKSTRLFNTTLWDKGEASGRRRVGFVSDRRRKRAMAVAVFDGVGYERAMNLATKFSSIYALSHATVDELVTAATTHKGKRKGDGIGRKLAQAIYDQIREEERNSNRNGR